MKPPWLQPVNLFGLAHTHLMRQGRLTFNHMQTHTPFTLLTEDT